MKEKHRKPMIAFLAIAAVLLVANRSFAEFDNAFDNATAHWPFENTDRLNDVIDPNTDLGLIWWFSGAPSPWGDISNGFINDLDGYIHLRTGSTRRLFVSSADAAPKLKFSQSITTWTRFKWDGGAATPIGRLMGTSGGSPNWGWSLGIPGDVYSGSATRASFWVSDDGSTTLEEASVDYPFAIDTWYDVAGTFDHTTGDVSVYVLDSYTSEILASNTISSTLTSLNTPDEEFRILSYAYEGAVQYVDIESAAIWDRALTEKEVIELANPKSLLMHENFEESNGFTAGAAVNGVNDWVGSGTYPDLMISRASADDLEFYSRGFLAASTMASNKWGIITKSHDVQTTGKIQWNFSFNTGIVNTVGYAAVLIVNGDSDGQFYCSVRPTDSTFKVQWKDSSGTFVQELLTVTFAEAGFTLAKREWYQFTVTYDIHRDTLSVDIRKEDETAVTHIYTGTSSNGLPVHPEEITVMLIGSHIAVDEIMVNYFPSICGDRHTEYAPTDLNQDCWINLRDFALIADKWMNCTDPGDSSCDLYH